MKCIAYTITDDKYFPWLSQWIFWHKNRFDDLIVFLLPGSEKCKNFLISKSINFIETNNNYHNAYYEIYKHVLECDISYWYAVIDVDEIFDIRFDAKDLIKYLEKNGYFYIWAEVVNRLPTSLDIIPLPKEENIFIDMPCSARIHQIVRKANSWKPVLRKSFVQSDIHDLVDSGKKYRKFHDPRQFLLHHFDLTKEGIEIIKYKAENLSSISHEYLNILSFISLSKNDKLSIIENIQVEHDPTIKLSLK